jgi:hypothetical protein
LLIAGEGLQGSEEGLLSEKYFLALRYYCQPVLGQFGATLGAKLVAKGALVGREMVISKNHEICHKSDTQHARVNAPSGDALGASWASVRRASTHTGPKHVAHTRTQKHRKRRRCWARFFCPLALRWLPLDRSLAFALSLSLSRSHSLALALSISLSRSRSLA